MLLKDYEPSDAGHSCDHGDPCACYVAGKESEQASYRRGREMGAAEAHRLIRDYAPKMHVNRCRCNVCLTIKKLFRSTPLEDAKRLSRGSKRQFSKPG